MLSCVRNTGSALLRLDTPRARGVAYSIVRVDVHDASAYGEYARIASQAVAEHGGEFLVRGGAAVQLEGEGRQRNVIIKWPDTATARKFYQGESYQEALRHGLPASTRDYVVVEGV